MIMLSCVSITPLGFPVVPGVVGAAQLQMPLDVLDERLGVVAQAPGIVVEDLLQRLASVLALQELVYLLLVLDDGKTDSGLIERIHHLICNRVLVERDGNPSEALRGGHGPVETRPVVPDDRQPVASPEASGRQTARQRPNFSCDLGPGPALPDPEVFLADGRPGSSHAGIVEQQPGKRVEVVFAIFSLSRRERARVRVFSLSRRERAGVRGLGRHRCCGSLTPERRELAVAPSTAASSRGSRFQLRTRAIESSIETATVGVSDPKTMRLSRPAIAARERTTGSPTTGQRSA